MKFIMSFGYFLIAFFLTFKVSEVNSQVITSKVDIPVVGFKCNDRVRDVVNVSAELRLPSLQNTPIPAVVLLHSNAGIIGVGDFYAKALNSAGIATLEIDSYTPRGVRSGNDCCMTAI